MRTWRCSVMNAISEARPGLLGFGLVAFAHVAPPVLVGLVGALASRSMYVPGGKGPPRSSHDRSSHVSSGVLFVALRPNRASEGCSCRTKYQPGDDASPLTWVSERAKAK